jgi:hypothetical protein
MNDNDDWEEVFRQAAGDNINSGTAHVATSVAPMPQKKRKRKRSKCATRGGNDGNASQFLLQASFLQPRRLVSSNPLRRTEMKSPFLQVNSCDEYHCSMANGDDNATNGSQDDNHSSSSYSTAPCSQCAQPSGMHRMNLNSLRHSSQEMVLKLFVTIRNIRCVCRLELLRLKQFALTVNGTANDGSHCISFRPNILSDLLDELQGIQSVADAEHLTEGIVCNVALLHLDSLVQHLQQMNVTTEQNDDAVRRRQFLECIMKCDEVYYRMFYNCLISQPRPTDRTELINASNSRIPPPLTYFSEWVQMDQDRTSGSDSNRMDRSNIVGMNLSENPLYRLHQFRSVETQTIFGKEWFHQSSCGSTTKSTEFQSLFLEWNRSCRDFLCHIYCYATLSNSLLKLLGIKLQYCYQCTNIIELGAGTGYLAHLLSTERSSGTPSTRLVHVVAYDIAPNPPPIVQTKKKYKHSPSSAVNEYHADMAGYYYPVMYGDCHSSTIFTVPLSTNEKTALLLCYAPPDNSMAYDALRSYCLHTKQSSSSQLLIHIGEFKGLTGTPAFEEYLVQHFTCVERWPCSTWGGIDAATVTIWTRHSAAPPLAIASGSMLLPCSHCHEMESTRRCQFLRSVVYCSQECYRAHYDEMMQEQDERCRLLRDDANEMLEFENESHFAVLQ